MRRTTRAYVILECADEVLVVQGWLGRQDWHLPGGGMKPQEEPVQAACRELFEETGVKIKSADLKQVVKGVWSTDGLKHHYCVFYGQLRRKQPIRLLRPELIKIAWVRPADLNLSNCPQEILTALGSVNLL